MQKCGLKCFKSESVPTVTLLPTRRSPKCPDANTDMGSHVLRYAVLPHAHGWQAGGVVPAALAFNQPLLRVPGVPVGAAAPPSLPVGRPLLDVRPLRASSLLPASVPVLVVDTVKPAEATLHPAANAADGGGGQALVVRLYEPHGCRGVARLSWDRLVLKARAAVLVSIMA